MVWCRDKVLFHSRCFGWCDHWIVNQFSEGNTTLHPVLGSHSANLRFPIIGLMMNLTSIQEEDFEDHRFSLKTIISRRIECKTFSEKIICNPIPLLSVERILGTPCTLINWYGWNFCDQNYFSKPYCQLCCAKHGIRTRLVGPASAFSNHTCVGEAKIDFKYNGMVELFHDITD